MKRLTLILILCMALCGVSRSFATPQIPERLVSGKDTLRMYTMPLSAWLEIPGNSEKLGLNQSVMSSACWRGYQGTWLLENGKLYLTQLTPCPNPGNISADLKAVFGDRYVDGRVFADWVNDELQISQGAMVMQGMFPVSKLDTFIKMKDGCRVSEKTYLNFEEEPGQWNVWDADIREKLAALIAEKIRWGKLGIEPEGVRVVRVGIEIDPKGRATVTGQDIPKKYSAELARILKQVRWNLLNARGVKQAAGINMPLRFDLKNRTVELSQF